MHTQMTLVIASLVALSLPMAVAVQAQERPAEESVMTRGALESILEERAKETDGIRASLEALLNREDVARTAGSAGIDIQRVKSAAAALSDSELREIEPHLKRADEMDVGGDAIVISSTVVIIGLLIIILVIVA